MSRLTLIAAALSVLGCSAPDDGGDANNGQTECTGGKCDSADGDFGASLEGRDDVIASFLRAAASEKGTLEGDFRGVLQGVGDVLGCGPETERTFVILMSKNGNFPRNITTRCSADPTSASRFFLSTQSDYGDREDINLRDFKLFAWDETASKYNTYEMKDDGSGEGPLYVDVEPSHCLTCHTAPTDMRVDDVPFTPIMNELTNPWSLWNAEPEFDSHMFDELIDATVAQAPIYTEMTEGSRLGSAADFETLTRASMNRVVSARINLRREPADLELALGLLRPMFCDETVNYASENHDSGEISTSIIIDDSIGHMYLAIRPDNWPHAWLNDGRMLLSSLAAGEEPLAVMPVRGEATLQVEVGLVGRRVFTPEQVLAVRALDWKRPVFSDFRCGLYERGRERLLANPVDLTDHSRTSSLLPVVFDELMKLEVEDPETGEVVLWDIAPAAGTVYSIADAMDPANQELLTYGLFEEFQVDLDGFAVELETYFDAVRRNETRAELSAERERRGCRATQYYPSAPDVPGIACSPE